MHDSPARPLTQLEQHLSAAMLADLPDPTCEYHQTRGERTECGDVAEMMLAMTCGHSAFYCLYHHEIMRARFIDARRGGLHCTADDAMHPHGKQVAIEWRFV